MADDGSKKSTSDQNWPISKFYFTVDFGGAMKNTSFQEISGLDIESQPIEYRAGDSSVFSTIKMPGITKSGNVTFKKGVFVKTKKNTLKKLLVLV